MHGIGKRGAYTSWVVQKGDLQRILSRGGAGKSCQESIDDDIDKGSADWLQLVQVLQNIRGKGIATMIGKIDGNQVVVKAQLARDAQSEYQIQEQLRRMQGFIRYECMFTCAGKKDYIEQFGTVNNKTKLCLARGTGMGVIVMPYYTNGSLEMYLRRTKKPNIDLVKRVLQTVVWNLFQAYDALGFTHGDLYPKNIVLDESNSPVLLDFEKSLFNSPHRLMTFWRDIDDLFDEVARYVLQDSLNDVARIVINHLARKQEPTQQLIKDLADAIASCR
jgi:serine/threonine protein kinase